MRAKRAVEIRPLCFRAVMERLKNVSGTKFRVMAQLWLHHMKDTSISLVKLFLKVCLLQICKSN
jgi:hypothetical protein